MATYKKRGYKPTEKPEVDNDIENFDNVEENSTTAEVFNTLDETASKTEDWVANNQKYIFVIIGVVAALVLGYLAYSEFVAQPKESEAMNDMSQAKVYFNEAVIGTQKDSLYTLALNGGEGKYGMLDIIENHSGTPAANIAEYYAGMAYLNLKDYTKAIEHLQEFSSEEEALAPLAKGGIGDAFVQLNQLDDALDYYKQAAEIRTNEFTTPMYLNKAGLIALELGKASDALKYFETIKNDYPTSTEASTVDVFIGKAQVLANK
ncbi:tetratricopeptide repeat family protein [Formosa agariphila KMM 3901]|uniref:Tetratricopeptide repeat family protein n=1 Tax=Formosa agariphila (strain DSM 15362 / KCTC 12365 / LMG 23005 / KMM 3901 / M-2Alg 35-1) TaxID=1347342 RepID=T2KIH1_FORAG|nr:tetratricopeptide repeat protein [Formosa agariphila]CDF78672.1 tetratricopeptide repeat family protein [Formosa agariphila KMM 3901]